jgi:hypothetical protein
MSSEIFGNWGIKKTEKRRKYICGFCVSVYGEMKSKKSKKGVNGDG